MIHLCKHIQIYHFTYMHIYLKPRMGLCWISAEIQKPYRFEARSANNYWIWIAFFLINISNTLFALFVNFLWFRKLGYNFCFLFLCSRYWILFLILLHDFSGFTNPAAGDCSPYHEARYKYNLCFICTRKKNLRGWYLKFLIVCHK